MGQLLQRPPIIPTSSGAGSLIGANVHATAQQVVPTSANTVLNTWNTVDFDTSGFFNAGTPSILKVPFAGIYWVHANISCAQNGSGNTTNFYSFRVNGVNTLLGFKSFSFNAVNQNACVSISALVQAAANDTYEVLVQQATGVNQNYGPLVAANTHNFMMLGLH